MGWIFGPPDLVDSVWTTTQFASFCVATPLQEAVARMWERSAAEGFAATIVAVFGVLRAVPLGGDRR